VLAVWSQFGVLMRRWGWWPFAMDYTATQLCLKSLASHVHEQGDDRDSHTRWWTKRPEWTAVLTKTRLGLTKLPGGILYLSDSKTCWCDNCPVLKGAGGWCSSSPRWRGEGLLCVDIKQEIPVGGTHKKQGWQASHLNKGDISQSNY
jgi:hypothetical protein